MTSMIQNPSKNYLRAVVQFWTAKDRVTKGNLTRLKGVFGGFSFSHAAMANSTDNFNKEELKFWLPLDLHVVASHEHVTLRANRRTKESIWKHLQTMSVSTFDLRSNGNCFFE